MIEKIRIKAETLEDLEVISSLLQDALFKVSDMTYLPGNLRFAFVANRFRWEAEVLRDQKPNKKIHQRVRSGLRFEGVLEAKYRNLTLADKSLVLSLLSITGQKKKGDYILVLTFSGGIAIRLLAETLEVYLEDITGPWGTKNLPEHPVA